MATKEVPQDYAALEAKFAEYRKQVEQGSVILTLTLAINAFTGDLSVNPGYPATRENALLMSEAVGKVQQILIKQVSRLPSAEKKE